jgi:cyclopropane-fatty-acyl-phospholipid synthase
MNYKETAQKLLKLADIEINGKQPWDIKVLNEKFYQRVVPQGSIAFGESFMDGWWECNELDELIDRISRAKLSKKIKPNLSLILFRLKAKIFNLQKTSRAFQVGEQHYDIGNDLYKAMLDKRLTYTCAYWDNGANTLDEAQEAKLDLVCKKIGLKPGQTVLDIGCGWGSFAKFAAENYGVKVVGITVSKKQVELAKELCKNLPIEIRMQDYRALNEQFDHIVSLGMFEHVGKKNYTKYMEIVRKNLKDDGLFLLHTIGSNNSNGVDPWIEKYIFPNSILPNVTDIINASAKLFILQDWHNFSYNYYYTLKAWMSNVDNKWHELKHNYDERFYRMWRYYLMVSAGSFKSGANQLWQIVFSKHAIDGGYKSIR